MVVGIVLGLLVVASLSEMSDGSDISDLSDESDKLYGPGGCVPEVKLSSGKSDKVGFPPVFFYLLGNLQHFRLVNALSAHYALASGHELAKRAGFPSKSAMRQFGNTV